MQKYFHSVAENRAKFENSTENQFATQMAKKLTQAVKKPGELADSLSGEFSVNINAPGINFGYYSCAPSVIREYIAGGPRIVVVDNPTRSFLEGLITNPKDFLPPFKNIDSSWTKDYNRQE